MYRKIEDFFTTWKHEADITLKTFGNLTDDSLGQKAFPAGRTLGFLAWHITVTLGEMMGKTGLRVDAPAEHSPVPKTAKEIYTAFEKSTNSLVEQIQKNWTDATLLEEDTMYGEPWKKGATLYALVLHQTHHRGQMTVLMRMAGLLVPGAYGPSKEEWVSFGMKAPD